MANKLITQCGQGGGLPACQVSSWSFQPFGHIHQRHRQDRQTDNSLIARTVFGRPFVHASAIAMQHTLRVGYI